MKFLALDVGQKRIGVATCDRLELTVRLHSVVPAGKESGKAIARLAEEEGVDALVVGLPLSMDGQERDACQRVRVFIAGLQNQVALPLFTEDERLTTCIAQDRLIEAGIPRQKWRLMIDAASAAEILDNFLAARRARGERPEQMPEPRAPIPESM